MRNDFFDQSENSMPRIGDQAPAFRSVTTKGTIYFPADYFGKWVILFSFPNDLTPISTSELVTLSSMQNDFKSLNCELVGLSVDKYSGQSLSLRGIKEKIACKGINDVEIRFPLIEDNPIEVARKYGLIQPNKNNSVAVRAVYFIDPECKIRAIIYYPLVLGINSDELKRVIEALLKEDEPISHPIQSQEIAKELLEIQKQAQNCYEWFFCTKELSEEKVINVN